MPLIHAAGLTKIYRQAIRAPGLFGALRHLVRPHYREKVAVAGVDLTIEAGEAVAYIGPNGAGKSTTIKMLTGVLVPTAGSLVVNGLVPHKQRIENAKYIGAVFGQRTQLWWDIPLSESFTLLKDIFEIPERVYRKNMERFTAMLGLEELLPLSARKLSLGQRMRADLAAALLHDPRIIYLDEPTIGLDIVVKEQVRQFIKEINREQQTTVMLTTHDLTDVEDICQRLIIIDEGRIIYDANIQTIKDTLARERTLHFHFRQLPEAAASISQAFPGVSVALQDESRLSITFDRFKISGGELASYVMRSGDILDMQIDEPRIEQIVKQFYQQRTPAGARQNGEGLGS